MLDPIEVRAHRLQQAFARVGEGDAAGCAGQQPDAEPFFDASDRVAEGRRRHAKLRCAARKATLAGYRGRLADRLGYRGPLLNFFHNYMPILPSYRMVGYPLLLMKNKGSHCHASAAGSSSLLP
jgi:hypothetical protein